MLKDKKLSYQKELEDYLEDQKVFQIFEDMMKALVVSKPKDPIQFLLTKLTSPDIKRLIIAGPPGSRRKEIALSLAEYLSEDGNFVCISVGDLLNKEISKKSQFGKQIVESRKIYSYVKDEIVIDLVKLQIELLEKDQKSWIIEGFPRTRLQALALHKMGIIPDKFLLLENEDNLAIDKIKKNLLSEEAIIQFKQEEIDDLAQSALKEYKLHIEGVKEVCKGFIIELEGNMPGGILLEEIARILKLNRTSAPRRPPRIILIGPPGSGKTTQAKKIAEKYKLQYLKVSHMIKDLIRIEGDSLKAKDLRSSLSTGGHISDEIVINLVKERLEQPDCLINGWILDGCPTTPEQIIRLRELGITPQLVVALELSDALVYEKIEQRRYDPVDGVYYKIMTDRGLSQEVLGRLIQQQEHTHPVVKQKLLDYRNFLASVDNEYSRQLIRINAEEEVDKVFLNFCDSIENSV